MLGVGDDSLLGLRRGLAMGETLGPGSEDILQRLDSISPPRYSETIWKISLLLIFGIEMVLATAAAASSPVSSASLLALSSFSCSSPTSARRLLRSEAPFSVPKSVSLLHASFQLSSRQFRSGCCGR